MEPTAAAWRFVFTARENSGYQVGGPEHLGRDTDGVDEVDGDRAASGTPSVTSSLVADGTVSWAMQFTLSGRRGG